MQHCEIIIKYESIPELKKLLQAYCIKPLIIPEYSNKNVVFNFHISGGLFGSTLGNEICERFSHTLIKMEVI